MNFAQQKFDTDEIKTKFRTKVDSQYFYLTMFAKITENEINICT